MKFHFPIIIIDEDFRSENTSGFGIRALAEAIEKEGKHTTEESKTKLLIEVKMFEEKM